MMNAGVSTACVHSRTTACPAGPSAHAQPAAPVQPSHGRYARRPPDRNSHARIRVCAVVPQDVSRRRESRPAITHRLNVDAVHARWALRHDHRAALAYHEPCLSERVRLASVPCRSEVEQSASSSTPLSRPSPSPHSSCLKTCTLGRRTRPGVQQVEFRTIRRDVHARWIHRKERA